jgi:hypothetical protein
LGEYPAWRGWLSIVVPANAATTTVLVARVQAVTSSIEIGEQWLLNVSFGLFLDLKVDRYFSATNY